jgi:flavorubredoxin
MNAIVVYESVWGNTAAVAKAIAEGLGPDARAYPTDEVPDDQLAKAELIVAGSPVFGFSLPTETMRQNILRSEADAPTPADLSHPSLRSWLDRLPAGRGHSAAFETRIWWSPRGATGTIEKRLSKLGYPPIAQAHKFVVRDKYGPLRDGELERATSWGRELRSTLDATASDNVAAQAR